MLNFAPEPTTLNSQLIKINESDTISTHKDEIKSYIRHQSKKKMKAIL